MKKQLYVKIAFFLLTAAALLSSCLKGSKDLGFTGTQAVVNFPATAFNGIVNDGGITPTANAQTINALINVNSTSPTASPIKLTLIIQNQTFLNTYNAANGTNFVLLPASYYTVGNLSLTIPAGQSSLSVPFTITNPASIPTNATYVIPLTLSNINGGILDQYNTIIYKSSPKNAYEANYAATGYVFHPSSPRAISATYPIITLGPVTCLAPMADLGTSNYNFAFDVNGSTVSNFVAKGVTPTGSASGFMTLDNPGNINYALAAPAVIGANGYNSTTYNNTYDAGTKTFWLHFGYDAAGNGQATYTRQFYMKLVRQ